MRRVWGGNIKKPTSWNIVVFHHFYLLGLWRKREVRSQGWFPVIIRERTALWREFEEFESMSFTVHTLRGCGSSTTLHRGKMKRNTKKKRKLPGRTTRNMTDTAMKFDRCDRMPRLRENDFLLPLNHRARRFLRDIRRRTDDIRTGSSRLTIHDTNKPKYGRPAAHTQRLHNITNCI